VTIGLQAQEQSTVLVHREMTPSINAYELVDESADITFPPFMFHAQVARVIFLKAEIP
jgi:hypothetical protein